MQVYQFPQVASEPVNSRPMIGPLIEAVGTSLFPKLLFESIQDNVKCVHLSAFASDRGARAMILAENRGAVRTAREVGQRYLDSYREFEPADAPDDTAADDRPAETFLFEITPSDVGHPDYRADCRTMARIGARISIIETRRSRSLRLNFYSAKSFAPHELDFIRTHASILMPLIWRHGKDCLKYDEPGNELELRLRQVAPDLTQRENQVCALIALGVTSEGIAIRLSMGLNTVLTYRKRAYKRLRISSQNELFRLIWSPRTRS